MAAIRRTLQKDVFEPNDERLLAVVHVTKVSKKKKNSFLCLTTTAEKPVTVAIYQVKKTDKNVFKKKCHWLLPELKSVDAKQDGQDSAEFELQFDKVYRWLASSVSEKHNFIEFLWKSCVRHLPKQRPPFLHFPMDVTEESIMAEEVVSSTGSLGGEEIDVEDVCEEGMTEAEQQQLENLLDKSSGAIVNMETFMEQLSKELSGLDGANIQSMVTSERQVEELMGLLEEALSVAEALEQELQSYEEVFQPVLTVLHKLEADNACLETAHSNNHHLLAELHSLAQLDLPKEHQDTIQQLNLTTKTGLDKAVAAGQSLQNALLVEKIHPALENMLAVQQQMKVLKPLSERFSQALNVHFNKMFVHLSNDPSDTLSVRANELSLPQFDAIHSELMPLSPLMHWLKAMDRTSYDGLVRVYVTYLARLYERNVRGFFEEARTRVGAPKDRRSSGKGGGSNQDLATSFTDNETFGLDAWQNQRFDEVFDRVLAELEPVCLAEQRFCVHFFQLNSAVSQLPDPSSPAEENGVSQKRLERQLNEEVRRIMSSLFSCLESELLSFITYYEKLDPYYLMKVLVCLSRHVMSAEDAGSYLSMTFASALVQVKRNFDRFMQGQLRLIEEGKPSRKTKCGILPSVTSFEEFATIAESIFRGSDRRVDLEKWYARLIRALFVAVPRMAVEHPKTPPEVIKMENFHRIHGTLSHMKVSSLDSLRKEAKQRYNEALQAYVTQYFGRPLEKLNQFFEGVQTRVAQGVKESEIGYQLAFSKQELRRVIREYTPREVKKGLESLYRKVERHLCEEENLLQVVWRAMQEEFIRQYKAIQELIDRCYPGLKIALEFSIGDLLTFFSEIAQSH